MATFGAFDYLQRQTMIYEAFTSTMQKASKGLPEDLKKVIFSDNRVEKGAFKEAHLWIQVNRINPALES